MSESNAEAFRRYIDVWVRGEVDQLDEMLGQGYVGHSGSDPNWDEDADQARKRIASYHAAHPGVRVEIHEQLSEGDLVATRMIAREANPSTGQEGVAVGFNISRYQAGKLVEEWALWERLP